MTSKLKLLVATGLSTAAIMGAAPALAADLGTDAGTGITNSVSVSFDVGGATQTAATDSDTFVVDRKVDLLVERVDAVNTNVAPNANDQAVSFNVTNQTNDTIDVLLSIQQLGGDDFDSTGAPSYYIDNGDGVFDSGTDTLVTSIEDLAEDDTVLIHVVTNIPANDSGGSPLTTGQTADVVLIGQAADTAGVAFVDNSGDADDATVVQNVFADDAGTATTGTGATPADGAGDGYHSATDTYEIATAALTATKTSTVISDPVTTAAGGSNPKAIPGAIVEYCIVVSNGAGSATAQSVNISDDLGAVGLGGNVDFVLGSIEVVTTASASATCSGTAQSDGTGDDAGEISGNVVSATLPDLAGGEFSALIFQVTIN